MPTVDTAAQALGAMSLSAAEAGGTATPCAAAAALPPDVLRRIFALALAMSCTVIDEETGEQEDICGIGAGDIAAHAPPTGELECLSLPLTGRAPLAGWRSLCLVCKSWASALRSIPLTLSMAPVKNLGAPALLRWLCSVNVVRLEFDQKQRPGPILGSPEFAARRGPHLAAVAAVADAASWQPSAYPQLTALALDCGHSSLGGGWGEEAFASQTVAGMEGLRHLQLNRFIKASALQHLPLRLEHLTLNLCEGDSVAECKELPKGLRLQSLDILAAGVALNWADLCRTQQRCTVRASKLLFIQIPAPPCVPADPAAAEQAICRRLAAGLQAGGCRHMELACSAPAQIAWPNPRLPDGGKASAKGSAKAKPKRAQQAEPPFEGCVLSLAEVASEMQHSGLLQTVQVSGGVAPQDASTSILVAQRLEAGKRVLSFLRPLDASQATQLTGQGAPVVSLHFAECEQGDPRSAAVLGSPNFVAASGGVLREAMHVVLERGLSLAPYTALDRLYALVPGPLSASALPAHLSDVKLTCLPSFPPAQRRFTAAQALAGQTSLKGLRLQGWANVDLTNLPRSVKCLTVLLPELPPGAVLGSPGGPLQLPPAGHVLDMIGVRLKPSSEQRTSGTHRMADGGSITVFDLGAGGLGGGALGAGSGFARMNLTELVQRAKVVVVEGRDVELVCSCAMDELGTLLASSPLQELQISCGYVGICFQGKHGSGGGSGGAGGSHAGTQGAGMMMGAGFLQMSLHMGGGGPGMWDVLAADNGNFHIRRSQAVGSRCSRSRGTASRA